MLDIHLKDQTVVSVSKFEKVVYSMSGSRYELSSKQFDSFRIFDTATYNFEGSNKISVRGDQILFVELSNS